MPPDRPRKRKVECHCRSKACGGKLVDPKTASRHGQLDHRLFLVSLPQPEPSMLAPAATRAPPPPSSLAGTLLLDSTMAALASSPPPPSLPRPSAPPPSSPPPPSSHPPSRASSSSSAASDTGLEDEGGQDGREELDAIWQELGRSRSPMSSPPHSDEEEDDDDDSIEVVGPDLPAPTVATLNALDPILYGQGVSGESMFNGDYPAWAQEVLWAMARLRSHHGLSMTAAEEFLRLIFGRILPAIGHVSAGPVRWPSLRRFLGIDVDNTIRYVVCPNAGCQQLSPPLLRPPPLPSSSSGPARPLPSPPPPCTLCGTTLAVGSINEFGYSSLVAWLGRLVTSEEVRHQLEAWRRRSRPPNPFGAGDDSPLLADVFDGEMWAEEASFLDGDGIRLVLGIGIDWFQPFNVNDPYPCGPIFVYVMNLPAAIRYKPEYVHVVGVMPGPKEASVYTMPSFFAPLLCELQRLETGIEICLGSPPSADANAAGSAASTSLADSAASAAVAVLPATSAAPAVAAPTPPPPPATTKISLRAKLKLFIGDSPARIKVGGFGGVRAATEVCPYCHISAADINKVALGEMVAAPRDPADHRRDSLAAAFLTRAQQTISVKETGARYSALYELGYWSSVTSCPVDVMHAIYLGLVRRTWHLLLVKGGLIVTAEMQWIHHLISRTIVPHTMVKLSPATGTPSGGTPTARQFVTLAKLMPTLLSAPFKASIKDFQGNRDEVWTRMLADEPLRDDDERADHWVRLVYPPAGERKGTPAPDATTTTTDSQPNRVNRYIHQGWLFEEIIVRLSVVVDYVHAKVLSLKDIAFVEEQLRLLVKALAVIPFTTYNAHIVAHLGDHLRRFGPPRTSWAFSVEKNNQTLRRMVRLSNKKKGQLEVTMTRTWSDRCIVDRRLAEIQPQDAAAPAGGKKSTSLSDRVRDRQTPFDPSVVATTLTTKPRCTTLADDVYQSLLSLLSRLYPQERFVPESLFPVFDAVEVKRTAWSHSAIVSNGLYFRSSSAPATKAGGNAFGFVERPGYRSAQSRFRPVQVLDVIKHVHRPCQSSSPTFVTLTLAIVRVFRVSERPDWYHCPGIKPFADVWRVELDNAVKPTVVLASSLVGNALVVPQTDRVAIFKMVL